MSADVLTITEVAERLGVSAAWVRAVIADGSLRSIQRVPRGRILIPCVALDEFLGSAS